MHRARILSFAATTPLLLLGLLAAHCAQGAQAKDPLPEEIQRWSSFAKTDPAVGGEARQSALEALGRAQADLKAGRRLLALQRAVNARADLATAVYVNQRPAEQKKDAAGFEAEWARMGKVLHADLAPASASAALKGVRPAALRALGEVALPQVREYYEASLAYGRNTAPANGIFYLGNSAGQREAVDFVRALSTPSSLQEPPVRSLHGELEALEADLLKAYKPPASIDQHGAFITASSILKEARELDAAGLRYGALLRYLQAAKLVAPLRQGSPAADAGDLERRLGELEDRLSKGNVDHSIGRLFVEQARDEPTAPKLALMVNDILPRYFAALEPARPEPPRLAPQVTVTLVRWPYI
jgi:hypothetical protein